MKSRKRLVFAVAAGLAWLGTTMRVIHDLYVTPGSSVAVRGLFGPYRSGLVGGLQQVFDDLSYFTHWSNLAIAVVWTALALDPSRDTPVFRVARNTALLMITLTGILYALLIAPTDHVTGWFNVLDNTIIHYINPVVALLVWLGSGQRRWFTWRHAWKMYIVPLGYMGFALTRGALTHTYPYSFFNVTQYGYQGVLTTMVVILIGSTAVVVMFIEADRLLSRSRDTTAKVHQV